MKELVIAFVIVLIIALIAVSNNPHSIDNGAEPVPTIQGEDSSASTTSTGAGQGDYQASPSTDDIEPEDVSTTSQEDQLENQNS